MPRTCTRMCVRVRWALLLITTVCIYRNISMQEFEGYTYKISAVALVGTKSKSCSCLTLPPPPHTRTHTYRDQAYVSGFAKRDHLGRTSDFESGKWRESTSDELPFALYCTALACSVAEICLRKAWNGKSMFSRKRPKTFTSGKKRKFRILSCY